MAQVTHFFAGANSGDGFQNLFSEIVDLEDTYDLMVLKGGPGVGKATFMREIGRSMEEAGTPVEYLWCSGDPDSLDGVVLPELRCAVVDGTSPHVVEPRYPAAVDRYVDLGRFYDLTAAKAAAEEVKAHTRAYKAAYIRAYHHLRAARQVELDAVERLPDAVAQDLFLLAHDVVVIVADVRFARGVEPGRTDAEQLDRRGAVQGGEDFEGLAHDVGHAGKRRFQLHHLFRFLVHGKHAVVRHGLDHVPDAGIKLRRASSRVQDVFHLRLEDG